MLSVQCTCIYLVLFFCCRCLIIFPGKSQVLPLELLNIAHCMEPLRVYLHIMVLLRFLHVRIHPNKSEWSCLFTVRVHLVKNFTPTSNHIIDCAQLLMCINYDVFCTNNTEEDNWREQPQGKRQC